MVKAKSSKRTTSTKTVLPPTHTTDIEAATADIGAFTTDDPVKAFEHFLPEAMALDETSITPSRIDVALARVNIARGVQSIRGYVGDITRKTPQISVKRLLELPSLVLALTYAEQRIPDAVSTGDIAQKLADIARPRELTLRYLEVIAELGLVPVDRVRSIRKGSGPLDRAEDCVAIAGIFREYREVINGKHPFSDDYLQQLSQNGAWLVARLKPGNAPKQASQRDPQAVVYDRFAKLIEEAHEDLRTVGVVLFGIKRVDEFVPSLGARTLNTANKDSAIPSEAEKKPVV